MSTLLNSRGEPMTFAKVASPKVDRQVGQQLGPYSNMSWRLPGGGIVQFDLEQLTLADFREMRNHYQLGASLNVLSFVMHQIDWQIESDVQEHRDFIEEEIREHWTKLIFAIAQSFWAGYSPSAVNYENRDGYVRIRKIKDLVPEECEVKWDEVQGWAPYGKPKPKIWRYDGFYQNGYEIPVANSFWYPLLSENGDLYGRKLLKPAFPAYFFSNLIHLYANRYFERFGEPLPIGRAPFDDEVQTSDGEYINGKKAMELVVSQIRNRSVTVLPSDRDPDSGQFEYSIEYLESQMRGADFERYMSRLDEEMSLSLFTPVLLFRTADVGSYNLGEAHMRIFQQMINAISGDIQYYIQKYLIDRLMVANFGENAPRVRWTYRRLGTVDMAVYKEILVEMIRQGAAKIDTEEMGELIGVTVEEQEVLTAPPATPAAATDDNFTLAAARTTLQEAVGRAAREVAKGNEIVTFGFRNRFMEALAADGCPDKQATDLADRLYGRVNSWLDGVQGAFEGNPSRVQELLTSVVDDQLKGL